MNQLAPNRLWVLLSRKLGSEISVNEGDELASMMAGHAEITELLQTLNCCHEPKMPHIEAEKSYTQHLAHKSLFLLIMKKIAKDLENVIAEFLNTEMLAKDWNYKAGPDKWTKKEIIGHLIDSAQINLQRFVRATYAENFKLTYDQVEWVNAQHYISADLQELLELWRLLNRQIIRVIENYPAGLLQIRCDTGKTTPDFHTIEYLARDYVNHIKHHLKAIELL